LEAEIEETCFLAIFFILEGWVVVVACGVTVYGHRGRRHYKWHYGMARHLLLAHQMHLYVEWEPMEAKLQKHLFSSFFAIFGDG
jgi:hypothetical protein